MPNRRRRIYGPQTLLPAVGPFANLSPPVAENLPNLNLSTPGAFFNFGQKTITNPAKYNVVTLTGFNSFVYGSEAIFLWCNKLILGNRGILSAVGGYGDSSKGGLGICGGGGGGSDAFFAGAFGGTGADSQSVNGSDGQNNSSSGGVGLYFAELFGSFNWPDGGSGAPGETVDDGFTTGFGGVGGGFSEPGFGNGGGGGGAIQGDNGGGGGAGGSLICVVANEIVHLVSGSINFYAGGGFGFDTFSTSGGGGGGGGGGSVYVAARIKRVASGDPDVSGGEGVYGTSNGNPGNFEFYQINPDNSLTTRAPSSVWP